MSESASLALIETKDCVFFYKSTTPELTTPVLGLIQGLYEKFPETARGLLRQKIYTNVPLTELCRATIKVAAKRSLVDPLLKIPTHKITLQIENNFPHPKQIEFDAKNATLTGKTAMQRALSLAASLEQKSEHRYLNSRRVAALLLSKDGVLLGSAVNQNALNKTLHAEMNLVQGYVALHKKLPEGAQVFSTLQPCRMCAAAILHYAQKQVWVYYAQADPGRLAQHTLLQQKSCQFQIDG